MEDAQEFNIPLDSPLDVNSHDMLVSVEQPKLLFNRQKYLGSLLTSSVRYEHDGWFAGWWVHEFNVQSSGDSNVTKDGVLLPQDAYKLFPMFIHSHRYYSFMVEGHKVDFIFKPVLDVLKGTNITVTQQDGKGTRVIATGLMTDGKSFSVSFNPFTAKVIESSFGNDYSLFARKDGYFTEIKAVPLKEKHFVKVRLYKKLSGFLYKQKGATGLWQGLSYSFSLTGDTVSILPDKQNIIEAISTEKEGEDIKFTYRKKETYPATIQFNTDDLTYRMMFAGLKDVLKNGCFDSEAVRPENSYSFSFVNELTDKVKTKKTTGVVKLELPVWLKMKCRFSIHKTEDLVEIVGKSGDVEIKRKIKATFHSYRLRKSEASLQDIMKLQAMGLQWQMRIKAEPLIKALFLYNPKMIAPDTGKKYSDLYLGPFEINSSFQEVLPLRYGTKNEYVANMNFDWYKGPCKDNLPYIKNPYYVKSSADEGNLPFSFKYTVPAFRINKEYDESKNIVFGNVDKKIVNLDFDFSKPISTSNPLLMENPDYKSEASKKAQHIADVSSNLPWVINKDRENAPNIGSDPYINWYPEDGKMCQNIWKQGNVPFIREAHHTNAIADWSDSQYVGHDKYVPNKDYRFNSGDAIAVENPKYYEGAQKGHNLPWVFNDSYDKNLHDFFGTLEKEVLVIPAVDKDKIVTDNKLYNANISVVKNAEYNNAFYKKGLIWKLECIYGKAGKEIPNVEYMPPSSFLKDLYVGDWSIFDGESEPEEKKVFTGLVGANNHVVSLCTIEQQCIKVRSTDASPYDVGTKYIDAYFKAVSLYENLFKAAIYGYEKNGNIKNKAQYFGISTALQVKSNELVLKYLADEQIDVFDYVQYIHFFWMLFSTRLISFGDRENSWCLPLCVPALLAYRIRYSKNDILKKDISLLRVEPYVIKDRNKFNLSPVKNISAQIQNGNILNGLVTFDFVLSASFPFFKCGPLKKTEYDKNGKPTESLIGENIYQYPAWIETDILFSSKEKFYHCTPFILQGQDAITLQVTSIVDVAKRLIGAVFSSFLNDATITIANPILPEEENEWLDEFDNDLVSDEHEENGVMVPGKYTGHKEHNYIQDVKITFLSSLSILFKYNVFTGKFVGDVIIKDDESKIYKFVSEPKIDKEDFTITFSLKDISIYSVLLQVTQILDKKGDCEKFEIESQNDNILCFKDTRSGKTVCVDTVKKILVTDGSYFLQDVLQQDDIQTYYMSKDSIVHFKYLQKGIINKEGIQEEVGINSVTFTIDGHKYICNVDTNMKAELLYHTTDIRNGNKKLLYKRDVSNVAMYLKQFWSNTAETENFWWYDANHVVQLTQHSIVIWRKISNVITDWMADGWEKVFEVDRSSIITSDIVYYTMTDAYQRTPLFILLSVIDENTALIQQYDIVNEKLVLVNKTEVSFEKKELGAGFTKKALRTYSKLQMYPVLKGSRISATCVAKSLIIGIAYAKGLDQWAIQIIGGEVVNVIHGYGYVGNNGTLTGGQLPERCVNASVGFKEVVYPFEALKDLDKIPNKCYGNGSLVYFVYEKISKIVSHFLFSADTFTVVNLELNNNYTTTYSSISQYYTAEYGLKENYIDISSYNSELVPKDIIEYIGKQTMDRVIKNSASAKFQHIWFLLLSLLNHTCGSYSYVWKNSTLVNEFGEVKPYDTVVYEKEHTKEITGDPYDLSIRFKLATALLENQGEISRKADYVLNEYDRDYDAGKLELEKDKEKKKTGLFYRANTDKIIKNNLQQTGLITYMCSTIVEMATLDMFYSINDKVQCFAGPGFVNHRFVGICVAQSVTDLQCDIKHIDYFVNYLCVMAEGIHGEYLKEMTIWDALVTLANITVHLTPSVLGTSVPVGAILALAMVGGGYVAFIAAQLNLYAYNFINSLIDTLSLRRTSAHIQSTLVKYKLDIEGKHNYGQRSMDFMYPAFGAKEVQYTNEAVIADIYKSMKELYISGKKDVSFDANGTPWNNFISKLAFENEQGARPFNLKENKEISFVQAMCHGKQTAVSAPENVAVIEGTSSILQTTSFVDKDIGVPDPVFPPSIIHDYMINEQWGIGYTATDGQIVSVSQDDTKILDGEPSNVVITNDFCGIASSYTAIEVKNFFDERYLRPVAMTPTALALNMNKVNCVHENKVYHAFDGYSNRIVSWKGDVGCDREYLYQQYLFQQNDHFKRSNIFPPSQMMGSFRQKPTVAIECEDPIINITQSYTKEEGFLNNTPGENKALKRFAIPVLSEPMSSLPAMVRTLQPYKLHTVEGITSLTTDIRNTQAAYKAPNSIDFNINGELYRATEEFICRLNEQDGVVAVQDIVATEGMKFIGATTQVAFFYSPATRLYYSFTGGNTINKIDVVHRFKKIVEGKWDFINQEVMLKSLLPDDNPLIVRLDNTMSGEVYPPTDTIWRKEGDFKMLSMPGGLVYQGPKRCIINRFVLNSYMFDDIKRNKRKWIKLDKHDFYKERDYHWVYKNIDTISPADTVFGWTHNPYKLATAMLGLNEEQDCKFEWSITFAWTKDIEKLYELNEYTTVCLQGETVTEGGTVLGEITHVPLFKEQFTRKGDAGYYTFQFQSGNGIGNRERLYIWSDGIIAVESIKLICKAISQHRTQPLVTHIDVKDMIEQ